MCLYLLPVALLQVVDADVAVVHEAPAGSSRRNRQPARKAAAARGNTAAAKPRGLSARTLAALTAGDSTPASSADGDGGGGTDSDAEVVAAVAASVAASHRGWLETSPGAWDWLVLWVGGVCVQTEGLEAS